MDKILSLKDQIKEMIFSLKHPPGPYDDDYLRSLNTVELFFYFGIVPAIFFGILIFLGF